jgi:hypothetical protein
MLTLGFFSDQLQLPIIWGIQHENKSAVLGSQITLQVKSYPATWNFQNTSVICCINHDMNYNIKSQF